MTDPPRLRQTSLEWRQVEGEVVVLDLQRSEYLAVNRSGATLWNLLTQGAPPAEMAAHLAERYGLDPARARADVDAFLAALAARHLLAPQVGRYDVASLRAAWWTLRAVHRARRCLGLPDFGAERLPPPPPVSGRVGHAVRGVLRRRPQTCLVKAVVLQRWYAAHDDRRDLVIGVTSPAKGFRAHAWVDGDPTCHDAGFVELLRRPAP